jgi:HIV Tat-specific factor 1
MYEDDKGQFKGDALVVYFRPESVNLAIQMLDDSEFRLGTEGPMGRMRVQAADFSYKSQQEAPEKKSKKDQTKIIKRTQKLNKYNISSIGLKMCSHLSSKLADWDDDDPQVLQEVSSRWDKVVILKHMFSLQELEVSKPSTDHTCSTLKVYQEDPGAILEIKEDIREECSKLGEVTNVVLFDKEPNGVASVRFANAEAARACVNVC